jgi:molybdate-binding protein/DNA-binding XRE family transcriptional regulator
MVKERPLPNRVRQFRQQRGWSQAEVSRKSNVSRAAVSAIEMRRLVPSVATAIALAKTLGCTVEDLFGITGDRIEEEAWAWSPASEPCRFWRAAVGERILRFPTEMSAAGILPHDGVFHLGESRLISENRPEKTLVLATCDPAANLLACEYERVTGFRMLPLYRNSQEALSLLQQGLVHVAGIHLAATKNEAANARAAKAALGEGFSLIRFANWEDGLAVQPSMQTSSVNGLVRSKLRWIGREPGSGARQCQDDVLGHRRPPHRVARDHRGIAEAIRCGWADVGICLRLVSVEAGLRFVRVRKEAYDLCFSESLQPDIRLKRLLEVVRSSSLRGLFESLPGYEFSANMEIRPI